ncbi:1,6-anhydro-N-acetylmuramyl-L-alanine amidase AmpD [Paraferrimonas sedimenticola]|uniref:1,6-anhydro-N-acetylmuramyl-L-alanine amidase AmpD n=1 Tax=Paraferrimonas sedimenticola TaxID=375674 RepID=A0AA37RXV3_9GAMM|nr:1,6-anhydro-N-acetylmuramyl-L-alanine amidase AmpD [Paraferrimonas sedimenticola]GLP97461.1 N-acetyl-anhydromuranmyl-L-alanine amidase [Paraferrimonas sedimenticola]
MSRDAQKGKGVLPWQTVAQRPSPHFDLRPDITDISLLVLHNISLPAGQFGQPYIDKLFMGCIQEDCPAELEELIGLRVSAHLFINREGLITQYVDMHSRAWHAGVSSFQGRERCNDFSIGIELEGTDDSGYSDEQYQALHKVSLYILETYPKITLDRIVGHEHIAPGRKTDPGPGFDWTGYRQRLVAAGIK